ncbi:MAG: hypothetical protein ACLP8B_04410 [Xanthobacteraceae bacterium]
MSKVAVSSALAPPRFPCCPACDTEMEFVSITPTCQSVTYEYICPNDGDRLNWECRQNSQNITRRIERNGRAAPQELLAQK